MGESAWAPYAKERSAALQVAVAGVSGYAGMELARLLLRHPRLQGNPPVFLGRAGEASQPLLAEVHPQLGNNNGMRKLRLVPFAWEELEARGVELLFLATPHEHSREWVPQAVARGLRVIDLSGAWRLQRAESRRVYGFSEDEGADAVVAQREAVYGLPELNRDQLAGARVIANPGCYATSIILALAPLLRAGLVDVERGIVCDAKSGVSGAGKALTARTHFMSAGDNVSAYGVFNHRHLGELLEQLHLDPEQIVFTPHLVPIPRGILTTIHLRLKEKASASVAAEQIERCFAQFYAGSQMVRWVGRSLPEIQHVAHTSFCDIGYEVAEDGQRVVLVSCLDNLLKGAAGQAVQNMNVAHGWDEAEGLL